jgi:hypothetical protein
VKLKVLISEVIILLLNQIIFNVEGWLVDVQIKFLLGFGFFYLFLDIIKLKFWMIVLNDRVASAVVVFWFTPCLIWRV